MGTKHKKNEKQFNVRKPYFTENFYLLFEWFWLKSNPISNLYFKIPVIPTATLTKSLLKLWSWRLATHFIH